MLLEDDEAVAVAVGLRTAATTAVAGADDRSVQALAKVLALMPPRLRRQMDAVSSQTETPGPWEGAPTVDATVLTTLAQACRDDELVEFDYTAREAETTHRRVEPFRLVALGRRWYLVSYDRDRQDWRSFRLDRIANPRPTGLKFRPRELPADDALTFVQQGIRRMPQQYAVRVRVAVAADVLQREVGRWGSVTPDGEGCVLVMNVDSLDWPVMVLASSGATSSWSRRRSWPSGSPRSARGSGCCGGSAGQARGLGSRARLPGRPGRGHRAHDRLLRQHQGHTRPRATEHGHRAVPPPTPASSQPPITWSQRHHRHRRRTASSPRPVLCSSGGVTAIR